MMERWFQYIVEGVVLTLISVVGLLGTLLSIRVLIKPSLSHAFSTLLVGLAACDASFLFLAILSIGMPSLWTWYKENVIVHMIPTMYGLVAVARTGSVYLTMAVTLERFFAIVRPLDKFSLKRLLLPSALTFAVVYNVPRFFELKKTKFKLTNETMVVGTELRHNPIYVSIYHVWGKLLVLEAIPYVVILVLNSLIVHKILQSMRFRRTFRQTQINRTLVKTHPDVAGEVSRAELDMEEDCCLEEGLRRISSDTNHSLLVKVSESQQSSASATLATTTTRSTTSRRRTMGVETSTSSCSLLQQQEISLGLTLVSISALFIFCQFFKIFPDVYEVVCEKSADNRCISTTHFIERMTSLANMFCCLNSAANHLIYMLRGAKFRHAFLHTYGLRKNGEAAHSHSMIVLRTVANTRSTLVNNNNNGHDNVVGRNSEPTADP